VSHPLASLIEPFLRRIGSMILRGGLHCDEGWMIPPVRLIRLVRRAVAATRAHLLEAARAQVRAWLHARYAPFSEPAAARRASSAPRARDRVSVPMFPMLPPLADPDRKLAARLVGRPSRPTTMARMRRRIAVLTRLAMESPAQAQRRIMRLAPTLARRIVRPAAGFSLKHVAPRRRADAVIVLVRPIRRPTAPPLRRSG